MAIFVESLRKRLLGTADDGLGGEVCVVWKLAVVGREVGAKVRSRRVSDEGKSRQQEFAGISGRARRSQIGSLAMACCTSEA